MIRHYDGGYKGSCDYDDELWEVIAEPPTEEMQSTNYLHWKGRSSVCDIPDGIENCDGMFSFCVFPSDFRFGSFDTSRVDSMMDMFSHATFNEGFTLGSNFDTRNVGSMRAMFMNAKLNSGFTLGDKFDTSEVVDMQCMFTGVVFTDPNALCSKFSVRNVEYAINMFSDATFCSGFTLGSQFKLSCEASVTGMFDGTKFNEDFRFEDGCYINYTPGDYEDFPITERTKLPSRVYKYLQEGVPIAEQNVVALYSMGSTEFTRETIVEFSKLIGKGIPLSVAYYQLMEKVDSFNVDGAYRIVRGRYLDNLKPAVSELLKLNSLGYSYVTIGDCRKVLIEKGYPVDLVNECIVDYLSEQYVSK